MNSDNKGLKILLASFYTPGIRAIESLIQMGFRPDQLHLLTHDTPRNETLLAFALAHQIQIKTSHIKSADTLNWIRQFHPDILFSLYFRDIVPQSLLELPSMGAVNLHPALLPKYRGTFSAPWAIINGEEYTGFTYHYMVPEVDAGNIILQRKVSIGPDDTAYSLYHKLISEGMAHFTQAFKLLVEERYKGEPQTGEPSYYPREVPYGGYINPKWPKDRIERFIRGMYFPPFKGSCVRLVSGEENEISSLAEYETLVATGQIANG